MRNKFHMKRKCRKIYVHGFKPILKSEILSLPTKIECVIYLHKKSPLVHLITNICSHDTITIEACHLTTGRCTGLLCRHSYLLGL